jgi:hypothetical protein
MISLWIAACASSGHEAPAPAATDSSAGVDAVASESPSPAGKRIIDDPNAPAVHVSASAAEASDSEEIVCRRETPTGSRMARKVCRTRAEIEARAEKDKESLERSQTIRTGGNCALNQSC